VHGAAVIALRRAMKAVSQNYQGLGNQPAVRGLLDLQKAEDPFLSETKLSEKEMERFRWMLNMPNMIVVDCVGRSGGLALFSQKCVEGKVSHRC
jgi:hypothetical protein